MIPEIPTPCWPRTVPEAIELQKELAEEVIVQPLPRPARIVGAIDLGHIGPPRRPTHQAAGIVVYDLETRQAIERHAIVRPITFPYIPGLLSFREAPSALEVIDRVKTPVDVFLIDGQGQAHPRRFGVACHIGVLIRQPTIGCAKSRLFGTQRSELPDHRSARIDLIDKEETIGVVLRTRSKVKPLFVSVGNLITLEESIEIVLQACDRYRLPEPARLVHNYVTRVAGGFEQPED